MLLNKNSKNINRKLAKKKNGGRVYLPSGEYSVNEPIRVNTPSLRLDGEVWAYNLDPNGVFETRYGTKLRLHGRDFPAISVGCENLAAGAMVTNVGIQGDIAGMDTRPLFDISSPSASAGVYFGGKRIDQGEFSKISCCGLAIGISASEDAELDACIFDRVNTDGCCIGVYFAPRASYYPHFRHCVMADNPSYGFFADGASSKARGYDIYGMDVTDCNFVRCCGSSPVTNEEPAAVYFKNISNCSFRDNLVECPGIFWYYGDNAKTNEERQPHKSTAIGLHIIGNKNRITNNVFKGSTREAMLIEGDGNLLICNVTDGDVIIDGKDNIVNCLAFTSENAKLILKGNACDTTTVFGVPDERILKIN